MASLVPANNPLSGINMQSALAINPVQQVSVPNAIDKGIDSANRQVLDRQTIDTNAFNQGVVEEDRAIMNQARTDFQTALTPEDYTEIVGRFDPAKAAEMRFNAPNVALDKRIAITAQREDVAKQMHNVTDPVQKQLIYDQAVQTYGQEFAAAFPGGGNDPILAAMGAASVSRLSPKQELAFQEAEVGLLASQAELEKLKREADAAKSDAALAKVEEKQRALNAQVGFIESIDQIDRVEAFMVENPRVTGVLGQVVRGIGIGGTAAFDFGAMINSINANLAFKELQKMRDNSKTGGALGQVSNIELELLKAAIASINPNMSMEQLQVSLNAVRKHYKNLQYISTHNPIGTPDGEENFGTGDYADFFGSPLNIDEYRASKGLDVYDEAIANTPGGSFRVTPSGKREPLQRQQIFTEENSGGGGVIDTINTGINSALGGTSTQPDPNALSSQTLDGGQLPTVSSTADFDALSSGDMFLENGHPYRKP